jgi:hypothetical protein
MLESTRRSVPITREMARSRKFEEARVFKGFEGQAAVST